MERKSPSLVDQRAYFMERQLKVLQPLYFPSTGATRGRRKVHSPKHNSNAHKQLIG
jgi:hypothetical protein